MKAAPSKKVAQKLVKGYGLVSGRVKKAAKDAEVAPPVQAQAGMPYAPPAAPPSEIKGEVKIEGHVAIEGLQVPEFMFDRKIKAAGLYGTAAEGEKVFMIYPLVPVKPAKNEPIFAYARISWDSGTNRYVYQVVEPQLSEKMKGMVEKLRDLLEQKLEIDFRKLKRFEAEEYLHKQVEELVAAYNFKLMDNERKILHYYIRRNFIGLGEIEPLMNDDQIEDISCDGTGIPIFVFHRNPKLGSVVTNVSFKTPDELDSFVVRVAQISGKSVSVVNPLLNGILPDGSRIQATLATDIARKGSNFTIRRFTTKPLTPIHLLNYNTMDLKTLSYLWMAVDFGKSVLVSGGTASGKTSMLNVLSLFIRPDKKIVSIEDTAELKLPHPHWVPQLARVATATDKKPGEIDLFDLLRESLRQRPDYIIVGEVRGTEAFVLFQEMATGHASLATIHAENLPRLVDRLTTPPISLPPGLLEALDVAVFMSSTRYKEMQVRRVTEIVEITGFNRKTNTPEVNTVFKWDPMTDKFLSPSKSAVLKSIADAKGLSEQKILEELERRMLVLNWLKEQNIYEYEDIYNVLNLYYTDPERVISVIKGEV